MSIFETTNKLICRTYKYKFSETLQRKLRFFKKKRKKTTQILVDKWFNNPLQISHCTGQSIIGKKIEQEKKKRLTIFHTLGVCIK